MAPKAQRNSEIGVNILEKALSTPRGIRLTFKDKKKAVYAQHQVHIARRHEMVTLEQTYEAGDERRYQSRYAGVRTRMETIEGTERYSLFVIPGSVDALEGLIDTEEQ